jgi:hypothetical protein
LASPRLKLSAIVPATDRPASLERCLAALRAGTRVPEEIIVVTEPAGAGPAAARNDGASRADGDVLLFVDSDVVVASDAVARAEAAFARDTGLTALFGSYDDRPEAPGAVSGFRNLLHHHVHQAAEGEVPTFWAGLGAVRASAFREAGGFDAERYPHASIEDIELGARLAASGGRIVADPAVQGTHLKRWTLASAVRTDFARRGVPWVELVVRSGAPAGILNLGWRHRLSAGLAVLATAALVRRRWPVAAGALGVFAVANRDLYVLIASRRGPGEATIAVGLHVIHHLTSAAALVAGLARAGRRDFGGSGVS